MKQTIFATIFGASCMLSAIVYGQDTPPAAPKSPKVKKEQKEEIIINKTDGDEEKMTIVVDGNNVTINGKPVQDMKGGNVKVITRKKIGTGDPEMDTFIFPKGDLDDDMLPPLPPIGVNKAMLGIMTTKGQDGAVITEVTKESGAEKAGLKKDDIITKIGDTKVSGPRDLTETIGNYKPEDKVEITYKRNGKELKTSATLSQNKAVRKRVIMKIDDDNFDFDMPDDMPLPPMENFRFRFNSKPKLGMQIQDIENGKGVKVKVVDVELPAAKAGLKEGDILRQMNGKDINGVDDVKATTSELKEGESLRITYEREGKTQTTELKIPKKLKTADL